MFVFLSWDTYCTRKRDKLKRRVRKGIPDSFRGLIWPLITGSSKLCASNRGLYERLIKQSSSHEEQIGRDINRTFPNHVFFKEDSGERQCVCVRVCVWVGVCACVCACGMAWHGMLGCAT